MLACYLDWCEDAAEAAEAYERWSSASRAEEAMWFTAYMAALEEEEVSARSYADVAAGRRDRSLRAGDAGSPSRP